MIVFNNHTNFNVLIRDSGNNITASIPAGGALQLSRNHINSLSVNASILIPTILYKTTVLFYHNNQFFLIDGDRMSVY